MSATTARRAIGIIRVSQVNGREGESFTSPSEQRDRIVAACERDGLTLVDTRMELDVSGGTPLDRRQGLRAAVEAVEARDADVLVVAHFDRLVRSLRVQDEVVSRVEAAGGKVLALDFGEVTNGTAAQWLSGTMVGAVSEYYRRSIKERSAEAQGRAVARGVAPFPNVPPGYQRRGDGVLEIGPDAEIVREAFRLRAEGASVQAVRDHLAVHGITRAYSKVNALLANRVYLGEIHFGELVNLAAHEPLIDADTFARAQRAQAARGRRAKSDRLLARLGVLRCGTCGARMVVGTANRSAYYLYRCPPVGDCPRRVTIAAEIAEGVVVDAVRATLADVEGRASVERNARDAEAALEAAERDLKTAIRNLAVIDDEADVQAQLLELRSVRDAAREHVDRLLGGRAEVVVNAADDWDRLSLDARRALIRATVERAVVGTEGRGAERVTVHLFSE